MFFKCFVHFLILIFTEKILPVTYTTFKEVKKLLKNKFWGFFCSVDLSFLCHFTLNGVGPFFQIKLHSFLHQYNFVKLVELQLCKTAMMQKNIGKRKILHTPLQVTVSKTSSLKSCFPAAFYSSQLRLKKWKTKKA